jgi:hypothetical protein
VTVIEDVDDLGERAVEGAAEVMGIMGDKVGDGAEEEVRQEALLLRSSSSNHSRPTLN